MAYYILKSYRLKKITAFEVFEVLSRQENCFFLDSSLNTGYQGRYSFLGIEPFYTFATRSQDPFPRLKEILDRQKISWPNSHIPFLGGAVGYLGYDLGFILERKIEKKAKPDLGAPDCFFGFYNHTIIIDHLKQLLYIFSTGLPETKSHLAKKLSQANFKRIYNLISKIDSVKNYKRSNKFKSRKPPLQLNSNFSKEDYFLAIRKAQEYIRKGDIYQVNLSQRFQGKTHLSAFEIYKQLRRSSPANFSAYLDLGDFQLLSSSPERFLKLQGNLVTTCPMKGTRPRSPDKLEDHRLRKDLLTSAKDQAELVMIVDLERNDLGRVCRYDSVRVTKLRNLEEYRTVFQTTATVKGRLHKDKDRFDLLRACFPGGSITGCPKIRAMEIIEELEPTRRSIYTGSLGYLSFSGNLDFNILIRTILKKGDSFYFDVGGGIVADSVPKEEYQETLIKARGMMEAINAL